MTLVRQGRITRALFVAEVCECLLETVARVAENLKWKMTLLSLVLGLFCLRQDLAE